MIEDYPLFGIGTGGWQANYMLYQAEYFLQATNSPYTLLADNIFYNADCIQCTKLKQGGTRNNGTDGSVERFQR